MDRTTPTRSRAPQRPGDRPTSASAAPGGQTGARTLGQGQLSRDAIGGRSRWRRAGRILGRVAIWSAPVILLASIAIVVGWVRLAHGPVSLPQLNKPIAEGISAELAGLVASVDNTILTLAPSGGLEIRLVNLKLSETDGSPVVSAPIASVKLSDRSFTQFSVVPERVELIEPRLALAYSADGGLTLRFSEAEALPPTEVPGAASSADSAASGSQQRSQLSAESRSGPPTLLKRIDIARLLADYTQAARRGTSNSSALKEIGFRNARVMIEEAGRTSEILVPEMDIDLAHHSRRSVISGHAVVASDRGDWRVSFLAEDSERTGRLTVKSSVRDLVPSSLGRAVPALALVGAFDLPVAADASIDLATSNGDIGAVNVALELGRGRVDFGEAAHAPFMIDAGLITASYDATSDQITISPSTLRWGDSRITLAGKLDRAKDKAGPDRWTYDIQSKDGVIAAEELSVAPMPIEALAVAGAIDTGADRIDISSARLKINGGEIALEGAISLGVGRNASARISATGGGITADALKATWPRLVAPDTRRWIGQHVAKGLVTSGRLFYASGDYAAATGQPLAKSGERISIAVEATGVAINALRDAPPVEGPRMLVMMENDALEVTMPDASMSPLPGQSVAFKSSRFMIADVLATLPESHLSFRTQAGLGAALETLKAMPFAGFDASAIPAAVIDGKLDGQFEIAMPLQPDLAPANIKVVGKGRVVDVKSKDKIGELSVQSGTIDIDVNEKQASAKGEMIVNGVLAKLDWQRLVDVEAQQQPPLKISARLDNSDRRQLGLELDQIVEGEVPMEVVIGGQGRQGQVQVRADLSSAELSIRPLAWRKAPGRRANLSFDLAQGKTHKTELQNFKIEGDDIGVEGWVALGDGNKLKEFFFPEFSLNLVSRLEVQGRRNSKDDWVVTARGVSYDAKDFFTSLLSFGGPTSEPDSAKAPGVELNAEIENVLGHSGVALRRFKLRTAKKAGKLTALDARGTLDGGAPLVANLSEGGGSRIIVAEAPDAGQAMKLVGFYSNIQGGRVKLEIDLDARGAAEKAGTLWVEKFKILGDPVVSEVFSSAPGDGPASGDGSGRKRVVRESFDFDRLKAPFSVGHGQFVLEDSYLKGPILGATLRGKLDYVSQRVNLGGTYVPLQGLNNALGGIPVIGDLLSGPRKEGIFGITFAIQGSMARPQVVVNPLSPLAPGIFRELFQMTAPNPQVQPRSDGSSTQPSEKRVRSSSSGSGSEKSTVDGWTSDTVVPPRAE
ncbi:MAG: AsmA-like C-terminal region-containing protein [Hyphomicrobium sp.]|nr:AsmA-like C-terminal region-containing protein [Hyphomicrobium sp.]